MGGWVRVGGLVGMLGRWVSGWLVGLVGGYECACVSLLF